MTCSAVWLAWGDQQSGSFLTLHVRRSTARGKTWSKDLLAVSNACNAALAITKNGATGFLCQELLSRSQWVTSLRFTTDKAPAGTPTKSFDPYLGDYVHLVAVANDFCGIFSANNAPDPSHFPSGVKCQRNANFTTKRLLDGNNTTRVPVSIDPFFFKVTPDPCQPLSDAANELAQKIQDLEGALASGEIPPPPRTPAKIAAVRAQIAKLRGSWRRCRNDWRPAGNNIRKDLRQVIVK